MNQSTTVSFYSEAIILKFASNAHAWAAARYKWPMTEGRISTTFASLTTSEDGYTTLEYPEGFRSDSIRLLTVGGKAFAKKNFYKFREFLENNPSDTSKICTDYARRVYINPNAGDLSGTVVAWGQFNVADIAYDTSADGIGDPNATTIFSSSEEDGNEAIIEKMMEYALTREKTPSSFYKGSLVSSASSHGAKAEAILEAIFKRIQEEQYAYHDTQNDGMWKRFDVIGGGFVDDLGRRDQF